MRWGWRGCWRGRSNCRSIDQVRFPARFGQLGIVLGPSIDRRVIPGRATVAVFCEQAKPFQRQRVEHVWLSMAVPVVSIWHMGVAVLDRLMQVPMAVGASGHGVVNMGVMPIVMPVGVFMF